jgi:predicted NodU family carbamoyl transferase
MGIQVKSRNTFTKVESPHDALSSFSRGALDNLFLGNVLISR